MNQVIDMLGLMGDAVDNIPGIKGIGEKPLPNFYRNIIPWIVSSTMQIRSKDRWAKRSGRMEGHGRHE